MNDSGDEIFAPMPNMLTGWCTKSVPSGFGPLIRCSGTVKIVGGFHKCEACGASYGPAKRKRKVKK